MKFSVRVLLLLWPFFLASACSESEISPEDQIRKVIEAGVEAAEERDLDDLKQLIHDQYLDQNGYGKKQLKGILQAYFFRHKNIHLFTRIDEIELLADNRASVRLHVAMAATAISDIESLISLRARLYEFELVLHRQDDWRVQQASWKPANIADLR